MHSAATRLLGAADKAEKTDGLRIPRQEGGAHGRDRPRQPAGAGAIEALKEKGSKIIVDKRQIVKVSKDKSGIVTKEKLTKTWTDWIDYWSVDFDFESKRELIRVKDEATGEIEEKWTRDYIFENEWQSFRTKKERGLELRNAYCEPDKKRVKIAVKVVDILGNDTTTIVDVR
jgi:hypothetical protein